MVKLYSDEEDFDDDSIFQKMHLWKKMHPIGRPAFIGTTTLKERNTVAIEEMWIRLTAHQPFASQWGYGEAWAKMCTERTPEAAKDAEAAIWSELKAARCTGVATWAALAASAAEAMVRLETSSPEMALIEASRAIEWITEAEAEE